MKREPSEGVAPFSRLESSMDPKFESDTRFAYIVSFVWIAIVAAWVIFKFESCR